MAPCKAMVGLPPGPPPRVRAGDAKLVWWG